MFIIIHIKLATYGEPWRWRGHSCCSCVFNLKLQETAGPLVILEARKWRRRIWSDVNKGTCFHPTCAVGFGASTTRFMATAHYGRGDNARSRRWGQRWRKRSAEIVWWGSTWRTRMTSRPRMPRVRVCRIFLNPRHFRVSASAMLEAASRCCVYWSNVIKDTYFTCTSTVGRPEAGAHGGAQIFRPRVGWHRSGLTDIKPGFWMLSLNI